MQKRPAILLTGFGPFPGVPINATAELVPRLSEAAAKQFTDHDVLAEVLPTQWDAAPTRLAAVLGENNVALALHFGVTNDAQGFQIELVGRNEQTQAADAAGRLPSRTCVIETGPALLASTFPAERIVARLVRLDIPCRTSSHAGTYLCNTVLYHSLSAGLACRTPHVAGFVHIPVKLVGSGADGRDPHPECPLDWSKAISGGLEIIHTCLEHIGSRQPTVKAG
jgi:pyroglutamyl-peptidase